MKNKNHYLLGGTFALLLFVILGYTVKFAPQGLTAFDSHLQAQLRGDLPTFWTSFFSTITQLANSGVIVIWVGALVGFFYYKKWKAEAGLLLTALISSGLLVLLLKPIYARPRPSIPYLVHETGFSFPSGHSLGITLVVGVLIIIASQRISKSGLRLACQLALGLLILTILVSRVYLGVHYPSDVTAGFLLGLACLQIVFPFYDQLRFKWRFSGKAK